MVIARGVDSSRMTWTWVRLKSSIWCQTMHGWEKMIPKIVLFGFKNYDAVNKKWVAVICINIFLLIYIYIYTYILLRRTRKYSKQKRQDLRLDLTLFSLDLDSTWTLPVLTWDLTQTWVQRLETYSWLAKQRPDPRLW